MLARSFRALRKQTQSGVTEHGMTGLDVLTFDSAMQGRLYAIDPNTDRTRLFYFPYVHGVIPVCLPG